MQATGTAGGYDFISRGNGLTKPSPVGEGGSRRLTDEVLSHRLKIAIIQTKMLQYIRCNSVEIVSYTIVGIS